MTIDGLWGGYLRKQNKVLDRNLSELSGKTIGIDAGMVLHAMYRSAGVARTFHQFPLVPLESSFEDALERVRITLSKYGIKAVFVCDVLSNPLKKEEDDRRGRERDESLAQLRTLYTTTANPTDDDLATALKLSKDSCRTTSRVIAQLKSWADLHPSSVTVQGSFYEADQQLASMCMDGTIDAVLGEDGDFLCNGAPLLITSLDYTSGACQMYRLTDVLLKFGPNFTLSDFHVFCTFSGCDYLKRPNRLTPMDHTLAYRKLTTQAEKTEYLQKLRRGSRFFGPTTIGLRQLL